jgi:circadian clock protein KaiC
MSPGEFSHLVRATVEQQKTRLVVIDSLNGFLQAMPSERLLALHLHELLSYLGRQGVATILLMAQHGLIAGQMDSPVDASYLADTVILLRFFEAAGEVCIAISVIKKRTGPHEHTIRQLRFEKGAIVVGEPIRDFVGVLSGTPTLVPQAPGRRPRRS